MCDYLSNGRNNRLQSVLQGVIAPLEEEEIAVQAERIGWLQYEKGGKRKRQKLSATFCKVGVSANQKHQKCETRFFSMPKATAAIACLVYFALLQLRDRISSKFFCERERSLFGQTHLHPAEPLLCLPPL